MRVLVVEDDPDLRAALGTALRGVGHAVEAVGTGEEALGWLAAQPFDLAVLDVGLPDRTGLEVCRAARGRGADLPILMLTARDTLADKVAGLDAGADDYLVKPFELDELLARVRALLRRREGPKSGVLTVGELRLDPATGEVSRAGAPLTLSRKQRALLEVFMRSPGRILTRDQLLDRVWEGEPPESDVVRAQIKLLRQAIGDAGPTRLIETVHGVGYRMSDHARDA